MKKNKISPGQSGAPALPEGQIPEIRPGQSVELLKELHILTRDGKLNQDSRRKLKQVYLSKFRFITLSRQLNIPVWLRLHFGFVQLSKLAIAYVLHLLKLNRLMLMLRGNSPVSIQLQNDLNEIFGSIEKASHEA